MGALAGAEKLLEGKPAKVLKLYEQQAISRSELVEILSVRNEPARKILPPKTRKAHQPDVRGHGAAGGQPEGRRGAEAGRCGVEDRR